MPIYEPDDFDDCDFEDRLKLQEDNHWLRRENFWLKVFIVLLVFAAVLWYYDITNLKIEELFK
jgi:hypothetical protein